MTEQTKKPSRQRAYQIRKLAAGMCSNCGQPRGKDGVSQRCRICQDKWNAMRHKRNLTKQLASAKTALSNEKAASKR